MKKTLSQWNQDIETDLGWDPKCSPVLSRVSEDTGASAIQGVASTAPQKALEKQAANSISRTRTVAQNQAPKVVSEQKRTDSGIAAAIQRAFELDVFTPESVIANVQNGIVSLEGEVMWKFEREAAERVVNYVTGVVGINNAITVKPQSSAMQIKAKIQAALHRQAINDTNAIQITSYDGTVTLTGTASSWQAVEVATNAAWAVPGVTQVVDRVNVRTNF